MARLIRLCTLYGHVVVFLRHRHMGSIVTTHYLICYREPIFIGHESVFRYSSAKSPHLVFIGPRVCNFGINNLLSQQIS